MKANERWRKRVHETRTVLDRLKGSRAQLPSGREAVVNDNNEGRAQCYGALDSASFLAPDLIFFVFRRVVICSSEQMFGDVETRF